MTEVWRRLKLRALAALHTIESRAMSKKLLFCMLPALIFVFYFSSLAPTVLWGDSAFFQRSAFDGSLPRDGGGHWLWLAMASAIIRLPFGEVAYQVNMLSALAGTATIFGLYWTAKSIGLSQTASLLAAGSLAVAHTFWMHSVTAEVYTVFTTLMVLEIAALVNWTEKTFWPLPVALALFGLTLLGHQMAILLLPAIGYSMWLGRKRLSGRNFLLALGAFLLGLLPALVIIQHQINPADLTQSLIAYFTRSGADFSHALFDFSISSFPRDMALWLGFLILQFPSPAILFGLVGFASIREWTRVDKWKIVAVLYATCVVFAFSYRVNDQYVFYLPSYIAFALMIGLGWDALSRKKSRLNRPLIAKTLVGLVVVFPPLVYFGLAHAFDNLGINPMQIRELPGREPSNYFLWPAKNNYWGAYSYGSSLLTDLPANSVLIADYTPFETLKYMQVVHNLRGDVRLILVGPQDDLRMIAKSFPPATSIFIADNDPRYYNLNSLTGMELIKQGFVYQLVMDPRIGG